MRAVILLNHAAGSLNGERDGVTPDDVRDACIRAGITPLLESAPPGDLPHRLRAALRQRPDAILVGGGDGTISTAAAQLAGTGVPLGVLPLGTLNHFARDLGLPADWRKAVSLLASGHARAVDVGEVNGRVFINNCSLGAYPEAVRKRDALRRLHGAGKWWAMLRASLAVFRRLRRVRLEIEGGDRALALRTPFAVVSNNRYSARVLDESLRPRLDEGKLWLYTTRAHRRLALLRLVWQSLRRRLDTVEGLEIHAFDALHIQPVLPRRPLPIALDGELVEMKPPLRFRIRPGALQVLVPLPAEAPGALPSAHSVNTGN